MATTTIRNYAIKNITTALTNTNPDYTLYADNHLELTKIGNVVMLTGYITNTNKCPIFKTLFSIPEAYKPIKGVSFIPLNRPSIEWFFIPAASGDCASQNMDCEPATRHFSVTWLTSA